MKRIAWVSCALALAILGGCGSASDAGEEPKASSSNGAPVAASGTETVPALGVDGASKGSGAAEAATSRGSSASGPTPTAGAPINSASAAPAPPSAATPSPTTPSSGSSMSTPAAPVDAPIAVSGAAGASAPTPSRVTTPPTPDQVPSGVLTAATWDDNRNFDRFSSYRKDLISAQTPGILPSSDDEHAQAHTKFADVHSARQTLDVSLVIDTTGSMGDEISYLQSEFLSLSEAIEAKYPNAQQQWSLIVYRDVGDEYLTRVFDFSSDANDFRDKLAQQVAEGGGDFPESPDAALAAMNELAWRSDDATARLAFWVADAPHHDAKAQAMLDAIHGAGDLDIHIYPVASSGVNELTELTMREAAQLTGGRYLFLTDDSGIGGAHKEPSIPCYFVTHLDQAILRMVDIELSGVYREPTASEIVRTGGDPQDGACTLESGQTVEVF
jgi:hypothetical protein